MREMQERVANAIVAAGYNPATSAAIARIAIEAIDGPDDRPPGHIRTIDGHLVHIDDAMKGPTPA